MMSIYSVPSVSGQGSRIRVCEGMDQGLSLVAWPYSQPEGIRAWIGDSAP
jgi:hypothetical protein